MMMERLSAVVFVVGVINLALAAHTPATTSTGTPAPTPVTTTSTGTPAPTPAATPSTGTPAHTPAATTSTGTPAPTPPATTSTGTPALTSPATTPLTEGPTSTESTTTSTNAPSTTSQFVAWNNDQFQERSEPCSRFVITERNVDFVNNESVFLVFNASKVSSCVDICHRTVYCNAFVARHSDGVMGCRLSFYTAGTRYGLGSDLWERVEL